MVRKATSDIQVAVEQRQMKGQSLEGQLGWTPSTLLQLRKRVVWHKRLYLPHIPMPPLLQVRNLRTGAPSILMTSTMQATMRQSSVNRVRRFAIPFQVILQASLQTPTGTAPVVPDRAGTDILRSPSPQPIPGLH